jgi:L-malate glycosyltransferase
MVLDLNLSDCVEFGGYRTDLPLLLPSFDCLVVASRGEPFGLVLLEAMRAGVPVVASNAGGVPEIVSDGINGLLFKSGDAEDLAGALQRVAEDSALAGRLCEEGRRAIRTRFSFENQVGSMQDLFEKFARAKGASR